MCVSLFISRGLSHFIVVLSLYIIIIIENHTQNREPAKQKESGQWEEGRRGSIPSLRQTLVDDALNVYPTSNKDSLADTPRYWLLFPIP